MGTVDVYRPLALAFDAYHAVEGSPQALSIALKPIKNHFHTVGAAAPAPAVAESVALLKGFHEPRFRAALYRLRY